MTAQTANPETTRTHEVEQSPAGHFQLHLSRLIGRIVVFAAGNAGPAPGSGEAPAHLRGAYPDNARPGTLPMADPLTLADPDMPWFSVKEAVLPFARFPGVGGCPATAQQLALVVPYVDDVTAMEVAFDALDAHGQQAGETVAVEEGVETGGRLTEIM